MMIYLIMNGMLPADCVSYTAPEITCSEKTKAQEYGKVIYLSIGAPNTTTTTHAKCATSRVQVLRLMKRVALFTE